jgi:multicomponent Na+:H+ antiporter subunit C
VYLVLAIVIGGLYAAGIYLILRRSLAKLIIGLALLTNAANLFIFTVGGLTRASPPLVPEGASAPPHPVADPLPQALILTAIVIGFGVLAFMMVLAYRTYAIVGSDNLDDMQSTDMLPYGTTASIPARPHEEEYVPEPAEVVQ